MQTDRSMSFGSIADQYNRLRPSPPPAAIDWLLPDRATLVVDLAAGTGLLSRAIGSQAGQILAVEPDTRMSTVLLAESPGVRAVAGVGEALPLRDGSADAVLISSAWHWMDPELAVPEIGRVLRDGGRFGLIWTSRDREVEWVRDIDLLREPVDSPSARLPPTGPEREDSPVATATSPCPSRIPSPISRRRRSHLPRRSRSTTTRR